ncbi:penicillin-insensitive murein endopeptidase, partial [Paenibacillus sp. GCM10023250]|uniref:penicillin-insensitive murein endopeptidase n=1 Tax=Paenibacillus sp. GCM10023250 TaxID=3252648 RepID=UPI003616AC84
MPRGGPFTSGHKSHQSGLDADIWFRFAPSVLSRAEREDPTPLDLVDDRRNRVNRQFSPQHLRLLPVFALIVRIQRQTTLAHGDQALPGAGRFHPRGRAPADVAARPYLAASGPALRPCATTLG